MSGTFDLRATSGALSSILGRFTTQSAPPPTITGISPASGPTGSTFTITGTNLSGATVTFTGGAVASLSSNTATSITGTVPTGATTGTVTVTTAGGSATTSFTVTVLSGDGAHVGPSDATLPVGLTYNPATMLCDGTVMDTTEPTWATTIALTDTGNPTTNHANLQAQVDTLRTTATGHTRITLPTGWRGDGHLILRENTTPHTIGICWADGGALPPLAPSAVAGETMPDKSNRPSFATHWTPMPRLRSTLNSEPLIRKQGPRVRGYWFRGIGMECRQTNGVLVGLNFLFPNTTNIISTATLVSASATSLTFSSEAFPTGNSSNIVLWIMRGTGAGQIRSGVTYDGPTRTFTMPGGQPLSVVPDATSRFVTIADELGSYSSPADLFPSDIVYAQCLSDGGGELAGCARTWYMSGARMAAVDCATRNLGNGGQDSQDFFVAAGPGPFKYTNCDSEIGGPKQNWMSGGISLPGDGTEQLPSDCEVRFNKMRWAGYGNTHKCSVEVKYGRRILVEANEASDQGAAVFAGEFVVKLTDQGGDNPNADTQNVCIRMNRANDSGGIGQLSGAEFYVGTNQTRNVDFISNVQASAAGNKGLQIGGGLRDVTVDHNTVVNTSGASFPRVLFFEGAAAGGYSTGPGIKCRNNVGASEDGVSWYIMAELDQFADITAPLGAGAVVSGNFINTTAHPRWANQLVVTGSADLMGFVDRANRNVALTPASPGYQAAAGKDVGAAAARVDAIMTRVV